MRDEEVISAKNRAKITFEIIKFTRPFMQMVYENLERHAGYTHMNLAY